MIDTQEDAAKKWCPFVRTVSNSVIGNRDNPNDSTLTNFDTASRCIGSACMAWRWSKKSDPRDGDARGYCGLAGQP